MNEKKEILSEERYQQNKKKLSIAALIILVIGLLIGGSLIAKGIMKQSEVNSRYSSESKESLQQQLATEKEKLEAKKTELASKGIKYDVFAEYDDGESYDLKVITNALDPSFNNCAFDEYQNNSYTSKYCSLKRQLEDNTDFRKRFDSFDSIPLYMFGAFIIISSCMIAGSIYMVAKRREILAFQVQQTMPVAQEGIEKMAPTLGKAGASIAKEVAPVYGDIAKEISKGIKEGLKDEDNK